MRSVANFFVDNKETINCKKYLDEISMKLEAAENYKKELFEQYQKLQNKFNSCKRIDDILSMNLELDSLSYLNADKIEKLSSDYYSDNTKLRKLRKRCNEKTKKINQSAFFIDKYVKKIRQYNSLVNEAQAYLQNRQISDYTNILFKLGFDKNHNLLCMLCDLKKKEITEIRNIDVVVLWGANHQRKDFYSDILMMKLDLELYFTKVNIEIGTIEVRSNKKRLGIGSFALKSLEDTIICELNKRIVRYNIVEKYKDDYFKINTISEIWGCSGSLSSDTNSEARKKFYIKNGYNMDGDRFSKNL